MTQKGKLWVFHEETEPQHGGEGVVRRILAYDDGMMMVENTFETGAVGALHSHPHLQTAYIAEGAFTFEIDGVGKIVKKGAFVVGEFLWLNVTVFGFLPIFLAKFLHR